MFKSFLPKIAAIPASAIPVALLGVVGHAPPIDGLVQKQHSTCIIPYIKHLMVTIPTILSLLAFVLKLRFPLKNAKQNEAISEGIAEHMLHLSADCPITGTPYKLVTLTPEEQQDTYTMDNFMGAKVAEGFLTNPKKQSAE